MTGRARFSVQEIAKVIAFIRCSPCLSKYNRSTVIRNECSFFWPLLLNHRIINIWKASNELRKGKKEKTQNSNELLTLFSCCPLPHARSQDNQSRTLLHFLLLQQPPFQVADKFLTPWTVSKRSPESDTLPHVPLQLIPSATPTGQRTGTRSTRRQARALQISTSEHPVIILVNAKTSRARRSPALITVVAREGGVASRVVLERNQFSDAVAVVCGEVHVRADGIGHVHAGDVFDGFGDGTASGRWVFAFRRTVVGALLRFAMRLFTFVCGSSRLCGYTGEIGFVWLMMYSRCRSNSVLWGASYCAGVAPPWIMAICSWTVRSFPRGKWVPIERLATFGSISAS